MHTRGLKFLKNLEWNLILPEVQFVLQPAVDKKLHMKTFK